MAEGHEEYVVQRILDSRIQRNRLKYYVDWEGYGPEERTWEPPTHLANAEDAIADYHRTYPNRPAPTDLRTHGRRTTDDGRRTAHELGPRDKRE